MGKPQTSLNDALQSYAIILQTRFRSGCGVAVLNALLRNSLSADASQGLPSDAYEVARCMYVRCAPIICHHLANALSLRLRRSGTKLIAAQFVKCRRLAGFAI